MSHSRLCLVSAGAETGGDRVLTRLDILSGDLCNCISDLVPHGTDLFSCQALE
jgi:hypothetical protein